MGLISKMQLSPSNRYPMKWHNHTLLFFGFLSLLMVFQMNAMINLGRSDTVVNFPSNPFGTTTNLAYTTTILFRTNDVNHIPSASADYSIATLENWSYIDPVDLLVQTLITPNDTISRIMDSPVQRIICYKHNRFNHAEFN